MDYHKDFDITWCQTLLKSDIDVVEIPQRPGQTSENGQSSQQDERVSNSMFTETLYTSTAIKAQINFKRPTKEPDAITGHEYCYLLSLGTGLDGKSGRAHGGFNALIIDQMTGTCAAQTSGSWAPATATMTVDYKAPIDTPQVILCRGWPIEKTGRKTWVKAVLEDGTGRLLASGKALFVDPKESKI